jgi:hypothetical protein
VRARCEDQAIVFVALTDLRLDDAILKVSARHLLVHEPHMGCKQATLVAYDIPLQIGKGYIQQIRLEHVFARRAQHRDLEPVLVERVGEYRPAGSAADDEDLLHDLAPYDAQNRHDPIALFLDRDDLVLRLRRPCTHVGLDARIGCPELDDVADLCAPVS